MADTRLCGVCGRVLSEVKSERGFEGWMHPDPALTEDHMAVPVSPDEVAGEFHCDFCFAEIPGVGGWTVEAESFPMLLITKPSGKTETHTSVTNWAACGDCAGLIKAHSWKTLTQKAAEVYYSQNPDSSIPFAYTYAQISLLYKKLRKHMTGLRPAVKEDLEK